MKFFVLLALVLAAIIGVSFGQAVEDMALTAEPVSELSAELDLAEDDEDDDDEDDEDMDLAEDDEDDEDDEDMDLAEDDEDDEDMDLAEDDDEDAESTDLYRRPDIRKYSNYKLHEYLNRLKLPSYYSQVRAYRGKCPKAYYRRRQYCHKVSKARRGYYIARWGSPTRDRVIKKCPSGTTTTKENQRKCSRTSLTNNNSNVSGGRCRNGFFKRNGRGHCLKASTARHGYYIARWGSPTRDRVIKKCPRGTTTYRTNRTRCVRRRR